MSQTQLQLQDCFLLFAPFSTLYIDRHSTPHGLQTLFSLFSNERLKFIISSVRQYVSLGHTWTRLSIQRNGMSWPCRGWYKKGSVVSCIYWLTFWKLAQELQKFIQPDIKTSQFSNVRDIRLSETKFCPLAIATLAPPALSTIRRGSTQENRLWH